MIKLSWTKVEQYEEPLIYFFLFLKMVYIYILNRNGQFRIHNIFIPRINYRKKIIFIND